MKYLTETELRRLFATIRDTQHQVLFRLMYEHGLRVSEAIRLKESDVNLSVTPARLRIRRVKKRRHHEQENKLKSETSLLLKRWMRRRKKHRAVERGNEYLFLSNKSRTSEDHISEPQVQSIFKNYLRQIGVNGERRNTHMLRHSCAIQMAKAGLNAFDIQAWLGHSSVTSSQEYVTMFGAEKEEREDRILDALSL